MALSLQIDFRVGQSGQIGGPPGCHHGQLAKFGGRLAASAAVPDEAAYADGSRLFAGLQAVLDPLPVTLALQAAAGNWAQAVFPSSELLLPALPPKG